MKEFDIVLKKYMDIFAGQEMYFINGIQSENGFRYRSPMYLVY
jgi:hypothetical protein